MKRLLLVYVFLSLAVTVSASERFEGVFVTAGPDVYRLTLNPDADRVQGELEIYGMAYALEGVVSGELLSGTLSGEGEYLNFSAERGSSGGLILLVQDPEMAAMGLPPERLEFSQASSVDLDGKRGMNEMDSQEGGVAKVLINGRPLLADQIQYLAETYGQAPLPGDYWYDSNSGLYGVRGYQAFGFMLPGHDFGPLEEDASAGDSGVFVNGRHIPQLEWVIWSQLLGYPIQWGRYWLDAQGNAGYEGNPVPVDNLYVAAQRNAVKGGGAGGDNFWTSRFSAGNYDQGNSRGYVSVPGHGPVGYGF